MNPWQSTERRSAAHSLVLSILGALASNADSLPQICTDRGGGVRIIPYQLSST